MQDLSFNAPRTNGRWTKEQHLKFLEGLRLYGKNWKKIEQLVSTRTGTQIRSHAQKFFLKSRQASPSEQHQLSPLSCDNYDHEEATLHSKTAPDTPLPSDDSYFLTRIMEYSVTQQCLDFWTALVDCRDATAILNRSTRNSSFMAYAQRKEEETSCEQNKEVQV